ncbi:MULTISPECIES: NADPH-dependent FMN reductase [Rhizobium]|uniref:NADPH-dependent FMN reductase n=1 Tax=Rhizobium TaxID=379 RepID=UPI00235E06CB|nr:MULTISPECIES: NAD(P)H-dependent oxidoreductase [unclassified Rhizobium]MDC9810716.1 NAD(P)H-dependent oxidoreductase [Rhizobium sp. MC62]WEA25154.1 NAD(P)H-dependent oxidoreductase [Rhizobium sp. MJ22]WEA59682.1 NAD(P)H-dependent oxidoreductase [Rhizobium sp. BJ04]
MKTSIRLAVIYGSTRKGRICDRVVKWLTQELVRFPQFEIDIIDPLDFALPPDRDMAHPEIDRLAGRLGMADAFIIVTPEYNHSFSAALKSTIDLFFEPWQGKPVAFVSYGGISGGLRAVEQLRLVFAELHAVTVRDSVSFSAPWSRFDVAGRLDDPSDALHTLDRMMARLEWWTRALIAARGDHPYADIAA